MEQQLLTAMGPAVRSERRAEMRRAFLVWIRYQRRAEVLAPLLGADLRFSPNIFARRWFRPADYLLKLLTTTVFLLRNRPQVAILQAPPVFSAFAAIATRTPYIIDAHNALVQSFWSSVPFTNFLVKRAAALIAHNDEINSVIRARFPESKVFVIPDPIVAIGDGKAKRDPKKILFICSFGRDEPVGLIPSIARALPDLSFIVTGKPDKLPDGVRARLQSCPNVTLPGYLATAEYHALLCSSAVAVVLTTMPAVQPSGACEALSSNTPLVVSRSRLTEAMFGEWAELSDNTVESLAEAIRSVSRQDLDLAGHRGRWNSNVAMRIAELDAFVDRQLATGAPR